jgi:N-acetylneuraminate lyase
MMKLKDLTKGEMNIINGPDELLCLGLMAGADAGIGTTYNIMTPEFVNLYNQFKSGDIDGARQTQFKVNRIIELLIKSDLLPSTKHAMGLMGVEMGDARFPFKHLSDAEIATFESELKRLGWQPDGRVL